MEYKRKRPSSFDVDSLRDEELTLRLEANRARQQVSICPKCDEGWILYRGDDGRDHQAWDCPHCVPRAKETNRAWRKVRDQLLEAGEAVDALDPYRKPYITYTDDQGAEMVGKVMAATRAYREGRITAEQLEEAIV